MSKKFFFVVHNFSNHAGGGVNRVVSEVANELSRDEEYSVNILSLAQVVGTAYPLHQAVTVHSLNMQKYATTQYKGFFKIIWLIRAYLKVLKFYFKQKSVATWNVTSPPLIILFFFLCKFSNQFIYCEHTSPQRKKMNFIIRKIRKIILNHADLTLSLNQSDQKFYENEGIKSKLLYNGITFPLLEKTTKEKIIIFVGRFEYEKDPLMALLMFFESNIWKKGYIFKMFGFGKYYCDIVEKINEYGVGEYVEIITNENDPEKIYKNASLLIMTSKYEGLPTVLIEAMSRGIPCISYDCPNGPAEIIKNGINGYLVENGKISKYIDILKNISKINFSEREIVDSVSSFNIKRTIKQWKKLF